MRKILIGIQTLAMLPVRLFSKISIFALIHKSNINQKVAILASSRIYWSNINKYTYIGAHCWIINTEIGSFCSIADNVMVGGGRHPLEFVSTSPVFYTKKNILKTCFAEVDFKEYNRTKVGNDVWIGTHAFIKGGVTIGHGAVIGAYSVVTKDIEPYAIVAGNPAKLLRMRFDDESIQKLIKSEWWNLSDEILKYKAKSFSNVEDFLKINGFN